VQKGRDFDKLIKDGPRFLVSRSELLQYPKARIAYQIGDQLQKFLTNEDSGLEASGKVIARIGASSFDDQRFRRLCWEVKATDIGVEGVWSHVAKSTEFSQYYYPYDNLIKWPLRAAQMSAQAFPKGTTFSARSQCLFAPEDQLPYFLACPSVRLFQGCCKMQMVCLPCRKTCRPTTRCASPGPASWLTTTAIPKILSAASAKPCTSSGATKRTTIEAEACSLLGVDSLRHYFGNPNNFFADHLSRYSKSRRAAPIYWPLTSGGGSYTLWLYYHRLHDGSLYQCVNDL
jgi:hypothetical protein